MLLLPQLKFSSWLFTVKSVDRTCLTRTGRSCAWWHWCEMIILFARGEFANSQFFKRLTRVKFWEDNSTKKGFGYISRKVIMMNGTVTNCGRDKRRADSHHLECNVTCVCSLIRSNRWAYIILVLCPSLACKVWWCVLSVHENNASQ